MKWEYIAEFPTYTLYVGMYKGANGKWYFNCGRMYDNGYQEWHPALIG